MLISPGSSAQVLQFAPEDVVPAGDDRRQIPSASPSEPAVGPADVAGALEAAAPPRRSHRRLLMRGESAVASIGISLAAILLAAMAGSSFWALHSQRTAWETARYEQAKTVANLLAQSSEVLLANDEVTTVRKLILDLAIAHDLQCQIVLSNGQVVASSDSSRITIPKLPAQWSLSQPLDEVLPAPINQQGICVSRPLTIGARGAAELHVNASLSRPLLAVWEAQTGIGGVGAVAMVALLWVYRRTRLKLRGVGAIREALVSAAAGETSLAALSISPEFGPEAVAWNELVAARERSARDAIAGRARDALGRRGNNKGDLNAACDALSQGLMLINDRRTVTYANGAATVFLGAPLEQLIGGNVCDFLHVPKVLVAIDSVITGTGRRRIVLDVERKADEQSGHAGVFRFTIRPVRKDDSAAAMVTIEDITQQKVAEEARNAFVAQATHELRTPLTNIRLYVESAIEDGENDAALRAKCLNVINGETRRLERIVGEMLSVAEIEAGSFRLKSAEVRLETIFSELRADYEPLALEKHIDLAFHLPPKLPPIKGDRDKLMLALHNLVGNALKYTPDAGRVSVTVDLNATQMTVAVTDTGIGIAPADAEKVFERFFRASDARVSKITGTGLGLTIAREVVRLHGGDIALESQLNKGSTFTMTLPVTVEAA